MRLPLFPLRTVLFPGAVLPLKIFEQRYMDMAKQCLRTDTGFGVCLIKHGEEVGTPAEPEQVGCLARISDWAMPQLGVLQVRAIGVQRFRAADLEVSAQGLLSAEVEIIEDEPSAPAALELEVCTRFLRAVVQSVGKDNFEPPLRFDEPSWVSFRLAELLPLPWASKQALLELDTASARLKQLARYLDEQGLG